MRLDAIVVEQVKRNFAAYVPDLPGCVAAPQCGQGETIAVCKEGDSWVIKEVSV